MKEEEETQHSFKTFSWVLGTTVCLCVCVFVCVCVGVLINKANNIIFSIKELLANTKSSIEI